MYPKARLEVVSDFVFETLKSDKLHRAVAEVCLLGGLTLAAYSTTIQDQPSREENERVEACAGKLGPEPQKVFGDDIPRACTRYAHDFEESTTLEGKNLSPQLLFQLPDADSFRYDHLKGPEYDEEVQDRYFQNSMGMVAFSGCLYVVSGMRRGLRHVDSIREIQEYANDHR